LFYVTVGFGYFFGLKSFKSQALMCAVFSVLLGLTILDLAHPYQGTHTISVFALVYAEKRMDAIDEVAAGRLADRPLGSLVTVGESQKCEEWRRYRTGGNNVPGGGMSPKSSTSSIPPVSRAHKSTAK
jgi:hypothetical protein